MLEIDRMTVSYRRDDGWWDAVRDASLCIASGEVVGLVGESGSGKSTLVLAALRALPENGAVRGGSILLAGRDLLTLTPAEMQQVWRGQIKLVPQNPLVSLNPSMRVGQQLAEALPAPASRRAQGSTPTAVLDALAAAQIADPPRVARSFPHQLSGGMQQRVMIAMALLAEPLLLVLDEPTTNLDVTTEAVILDLVRDLVRQRSTAVLYVSHNLGVLAGICDRVAVLYAGELVEDAPVSRLYRQPLHPYTAGLLHSVPRPGVNRHQAALLPIPGSVPQPGERLAGCVFANRCPIAVDRCVAERPDASLAAADHAVRCHRWSEIAAGDTHVPAALAAPAGVRPLPTSTSPGETVLAIHDLHKRFDQPRSLGDLLAGRPGRQVRAVDGISVQIGRGRTLGLVGESGSGKTTLARCIVGLAERSGGDVILLNIPLAPTVSQRDSAVLRRLQMVFQSPDEALNPHRTVGQMLTRTLTRLAGLSKAEAQQRASELLAAVKLDPSYLDRLPGQLSGGERQRVAIARAFASQPDLVLFDESVSALDVSVQAAILNLLSELQGAGDAAYLFISHDLAVVSYLADDVAVMYLGQVVEIGPAERVFQPPHHPYTEALLSAVPTLEPVGRRQRIHLQGDTLGASAAGVPSGCRFHTRCPRFLGDLCAQHEPPWQDGGEGHWIRCHISIDELARGVGSG